MKFTWQELLLRVAIFLSTTLVSEGVNYTYGPQLFSTTSGGEGGSTRGVYLYYDWWLPEGVVHLYKASVVRRRPVRFQIWRPIDISRNIFRLHREKRFEPTVVFEQAQVTEIPLSPSEYVFTQAGDRLAIYNEQDLSALPHRPRTSRVFYAYVDDSTKVGIGYQTTFYECCQPGFNPFEFSASATLDTDISWYQRRVEGRTPGPNTITPTSFPDVTPSPVVPPGEGTLIYRGHPTEGRTSRRESGARGIFLLDDVILQDGVIRAFYLYAVAFTPVRLQLWRPDDVTERQYALVGEYRYAPASLGLREVTLSWGEYLLARSGDRLGFTNEDSMSPIGYRFSAPQPNGFRTLTASLPEGQYPYVGQPVIFSGVQSPYDFALGVSQDLDIRNYPETSIRTFPNVVTQRPTTTATTTTTTARATTTTTTTTTTLSPSQPSDQPDTTGITVRQGETLVSEDPGSATRVLPSGARGTFIVPSLAFSQAGTVTSFWASVVTEGSVQFQVWRPLGVDGQTRNFQLLGKKNYTAQAADVGRMKEILLVQSERIQVGRGDLVGFVNSQPGSVLGYKFRASNRSLYRAPTSGHLGVGAIQQFEVSDLPYNFGLSAAFIPDNTGVTPTTKPLTNVTQKDGGNGNDKTSTTVSPNDSLPNQPGGQAAAATDSEDSGFVKFLKNPYVLLTLFIWLLLLTIILITICCCIYCRKCRSEQQTYQGNGTSRHAAAYINWGGGMRDNDSLEYFNPSIGGPGVGLPGSSRGTVRNNNGKDTQGEVEDGKPTTNFHDL